MMVKISDGKFANDLRECLLRSGLTPGDLKNLVEVAQGRGAGLDQITIAVVSPEAPFFPKFLGQYEQMTGTAGETDRSLALSMTMEGLLMFTAGLLGGPETEQAIKLHGEIEEVRGRGVPVCFFEAKAFTLTFVEVHPRGDVTVPPGFESGSN